MPAVSLQSVDPFKDLRAPAQFSCVSLTNCLEKLYSANENARGRFSGTLSDSVDQAISALRSAGPADLSVSGLWEWAEAVKARNECWRFMELHSLVCGLPPQEVSASLGSQILAWVLLYPDPDCERRQPIMDHLDELGTGVNDFHAAARTAWVLPGGARRIQQILAQYGIFRALRNGWTWRERLPELVRNYSKAATPLTAKDAEQYGIEAMLLNGDSSSCRAHGWHNSWMRQRFPSGKGDKRYDIFMDSPSGIMLLFRGQPCAMIAFHASSEGALFVNQIHGCRAKVMQDEDFEKQDADGRPVMVGQRGLMRLRYVELMIHLAEDFSRALGFSALVIQGACNNKWTKMLDVHGAPNLDLQSAKAVYDEIPEKLGYTLDENGNRVKALRQSLSGGFVGG